MNEYDNDKIDGGVGGRQRGGGGEGAGGRERE